jgi:hypothetical protein
VFEILVPYIGYLISLVICGVAILQKDPPLRWSAGVFIIGWMLTPAVTHVTRSGWDTPVAIIDTNAALILTWVSLRWRRLWSLVFAALMILLVVVRVTAYLDRSIVRYAYQASNNIIVVFQMLTLVVATVLTIRARGRADEGAVRS